MYIYRAVCPVRVIHEIFAHMVDDNEWAQRELVPDMNLRDSRYKRGECEKSLLLQVEV